MTELQFDAVVIDLDIYPRAEWSSSTVERYAEAMTAGETLPPIILEQDTNRLLDGMHRYQAHKRNGLAVIEVEYHEVPAGIPPRLYAASLSARHGDRMNGKDLQGVARDTIAANPEFNIQTVARLLGVTRQTVGRWVGDITERRRMVRKVKALLLDRLGWTQGQIGEYLEVSQKTVSDDVRDDISTSLTEDILRDALDGLPARCGDIAEGIREERIFASWSDEERDLLKQLRAGEIVVVSLREHHQNLVSWADSAGLLVRIDRKSEWGNPFVLDDDGTREQVIAKYSRHYLPNKPSLLKKLTTLHGRALACWCAPEPCHGDVLKERAEE